MAASWYSSDLYGPSPQTPSITGSPLQHAAADDMGSGWAALVNPHNPLLWFGGILAVTVGAVGVAGSARVGKGTVSASVGKV